ncbi:MAG: transposase [Myxococcales bacterium]|nr:transposase [Myxococcales bacterium]
MLSPDHIHHISSRTVLGRYAFHPDDPAFVAEVWGIVAAATARYGVGLVGFVLTSNHFHALLRARTAVAVSGWVQYVKARLAELTHARHGTRGTVWDGRYRVSTLLDAPAAAHWLRYLLSHGVKEGLVASPLDWPGAHCARALVGDGVVEGVVLDRVAWRQARRRGGEPDRRAFLRPVRLRFVPLPGWDDASWRRYCQAVVAGIIAEHADRELPATYDPRGRDARYIPEKVAWGPCPRFDARGESARALVAAAWEATEGAILHAQAQMARLVAGAPDALRIHEGLQWPRAVLVAAARPGEDFIWSTPARFSAGRVLGHLTEVVGAGAWPDLAGA